jgi:hypothetical protein
MVDLLDKHSVMVVLGERTKPFQVCGIAVLMEALVEAPELECTPVTKPSVVVVVDILVVEVQVAA